MRKKGRKKMPEVDHRAELVPIQYANDLWNCGQFAAVVVAEHTHWKDTGVKRKLSERFVMYHAYPQRPAGRGTLTASTPQCFPQVGVCWAEDWPWPGRRNPDLQPSPPQAARARQHRSPVTEIHHQNIETLRYHLDHRRVFDLRLWVDSDVWFNAPFGNIPMPLRQSDLDVGHVVVVVGYELDANAPGGGRFIFQNNWGTGWGDQGYGTLPFEYVRQWGLSSDDELAAFIMPEEHCVTYRSRCRTTGPLSAVVHGDKFHFFFHGAGSETIWMQTHNGEAWEGESLVSYDGAGLTQGGIAAASFQGKVYIFYKGRTTPNIYSRQLDDSGWSPEQNISDISPSATSHAPTCCVFQNVLWIFYKGRSTSNIWFNRFDGNQWLGEQNLSNISPSLTNAALTATVHDGQLYLAWCGNGNNSIWVNRFDGNNWAGESRIVASENGTDRPPTLASHKGELFLIYKRADDSTPHGSLLCRVLRNNNWQPAFSITELSPCLTDQQIGAASFRDRLRLVYKGQGTSQIWSNAGWSTVYELVQP
jgi:hypothetical protein